MVRVKFGNGKRSALNFPNLIGVILLSLGIVTLIVATIISSYYYVSSYYYAPALIGLGLGLGLVFWGIILTYIQTDEYLKKTVLDSTASTLLTALNETMETLDYRGKAVYLPPKYLNDPESIKIYMNKLETGMLPSPDATQKLDAQPSHRSSQDLLITPPGAELAKLFETTLGTSFLRMNLNNLQQRLPKALIEDLEVATDFEIQQVSSNETETSQDRLRTTHEEILVKYTTAAYRETDKRAAQLSAVYGNMGTPLSSSIAVAIAKATGKPVKIKSQHTSDDGKTSEITYELLEEQTP